MKKFIILGCENSHANQYLKQMAEGKFPELECVGVYSIEEEAAKKVSEEFGVPVLKTIDEMVGKVDGVIITARDGKYHYPYAKPYLDSGIPLFVDKPITNDPAEAVEFMRECKEKGVRLSGGSTVVLWPEAIRLKEFAENSEQIVGGFISAPVKLDSEYGGYWFYSQHLAQLVTYIFGCPCAVTATCTDDRLGMTFHYEDYDVAGLHYTPNEYFGSVIARKDALGLRIGAEKESIREGYAIELSRFERLMNGGEMETTYDEMILPIFLMHAIERAYTEGGTVEVDVCPV